MTCTSTAMRYIDMLLALPVGQWTTTASVHKHLASLGYRVSRRTVERDMRKLAEPFGVEMRPVHGHLVEWRLPAVAQEERAVAQEERAAPASFRTALALRRRRDARVTA